MDLRLRSVKVGIKSGKETLSQEALIQGGLVIIISLEVPPGKPEGLLLKRNPSSVELVWDHVEGAEG